MFMSVDRLLSGYINEEIDTTALGAFLTTVADDAAMFDVFMDAVVIEVAMAAVIDAMKGCMMPANVTVESSTTGFASTSESSVPG